MTDKPIVPTTTFSDNPRDGVLIARTVILGTDPDKHKVSVVTPYHYLLIVPRPDTFDGRKVIALEFYDMNGPPVPKHDLLPGLDGEDAPP